MIKDILERHPIEWLEKVLELILDSEFSVDCIGGCYKVSIDPKFYIGNLCGSFTDKKGFLRFKDGLHPIFEELKTLSVIDDFHKNDHDFEDFDHNDLRWELYGDTSTGKIPENAPDEEVYMYLKWAWPYDVFCNKEKVELFRDILFKRNKRRYLCNLETLKFLSEFTTDIDVESLIYWLRLDDKFVFYDAEVLLYSAAVSDKKHLAMLFFYFAKKMGDESRHYFFSEILDFEDSIVLHNEKYNYPDEYKGFYFKNEAPSIKTPIPGNGNVRYENDTLIIGKNKPVPFKGAKKQWDFLRLLLENSHRHVSSHEFKESQIDLKTVLDDIKKKLKSSGISALERKQLFHYYVEGGTGYCRILL